MKNPEDWKYTYAENPVYISVSNVPEPPVLTPIHLQEVMEETTVNLSCSAEAPCPKQPPTVFWSNIPESANITTWLQEKPDKTQSVFSHVTFQASYMDNRKNISCTATYPRNIPNDSTVVTTMILRVLFSPKETHIIINPSDAVSVGTNVTLTCKSKASPNEMNYTWYKHGQEKVLDFGEQLTLSVNGRSEGWYFCTAKNIHGTQTSEEIQLIVEKVRKSLLILSSRPLEMFVIQIPFFTIIIIIFSAVLLHTHSADAYIAVMPQTVAALTGSCVQIPCTFNISKFEEKRNRSKLLHGIWLKNTSHFAKTDSFIAYNSSKNIIRGFSDIQMTGDLNEKNCTTVFYNIMMNHSDHYYFRLEMEPYVFRATFNRNAVDSPDSSKTVRITVRDSPQPPELKPNDLHYVLEKNTVNLRCSAEAPCPKQPPKISWSNIPESAHITTQLQEKPDKTQSVFSYMTFKASYMDHRKNISCIATYPRNTPDDSTVETTMMLQVLFPPKETHIIITPSGAVSVGTNVTLTCKSKASPSNDLNYTWYKRGQEMPIAWGKKITITIPHSNTGCYSCTAQNKYGSHSSAVVQLIAEGQDGHSMALIAGFVGEIVVVLTLSAIRFCTRTKTFNKPRDNKNNPFGQVNDTDAHYVNIVRDIMISGRITSDDQTTVIVYFEETDISKQQNYCTTETLFNHDEYTEINKISQRGGHLHELLLFFDCTALRAPEMSMLHITSFIIISSVFLHTHSADDTYTAVMPQTVTALTGSCVQIPCTFNVSKFEEKRNRSKSLHGIWLKNKSQFANTGSFIAFNSSKNIIKGFRDIKITGDLTKMNCTTVFYNIMKNHSDRYYFRLEMESNGFRATFNPDTADSSDSSKTVNISVRDSPQPPILSPTDLQEVMEGTTVNLSCSAEAPCPEQPPKISWSNIPESAQITTQLEEKPDKTQSVFSYMAFKASYKDHRKNISCTATYPRNIPDDSTVETVMLQVMFSPKETHINIKPPSVSVGTNVTLTCQSKGGPSNEMNYTWYKRGQEMLIAREKKITFIVNNSNAGLYFCIAHNKHGNQSSAEIQLTAEDGRSMPLIAGFVGGTVAVLTLSAIGFCTRTRKKSNRRDNAGEKDSLNQDERNSTYASILTMTNQDNQISDDQSVLDCNTEFNTQIDHITEKESTEEDNTEKGSDVVYAQPLAGPQYVQLVCVFFRCFRWDPLFMSGPPVAARGLGRQSLQSDNSALQEYFLTLISPYITAVPGPTGPLIRVTCFSSGLLDSLVPSPGELSEAFTSLDAPGHPWLDTWLYNPVSHTSDLVNRSSAD
ncbi:hypothetical protein QQF64_022126 [Cirrhinus molitorella]|uniref:Ig-like domain-containing protein n=1 Tax=Cirrhinus molitorella TaxID=172907 RepID=A0ABR3LB91_9TELE